jgi:3-oxoacyl-[acyl-carrier protein] reductase
VRNVIVTGGSRGLGLATAAQLARGGWRVIAVARTESEELRAARAALEAANPGALCFRAFDLSEVAKLATLVGELRREFGALYGLVNNAGIGTGGVLALMRDAQIDYLTRLNVTSPIVLTKYVLRSMMLQRSGRIVNVASVVAATGYSGLSAYAATKAALVGFTRSLAREVGQLGITVNAVAPGFIDTEMTSVLTPEERERIARRSALRRLADPGDVASAIEFLLSDRAANITGTVITVDAGNTA